MSPAEQTVRDLFAAFSARDAEAALALVHPDVEFWAEPTADLAGRAEPYRGRDGFRAYLADVERVWDEFAVDPQDFRVAGTGVIAFGVAEGRPKDAGHDERQRIPVIWVFRLADGLVVFCRVARTAAEAAALAAGADAAQP